MRTTPYTAACKASELAKAEFKTLAQQEADAASRSAPASRQYVRRRIGHPLFKNGTLEQIATVLRAAPVGEVVFRPSSKA